MRIVLNAAAVLSFVFSTAVFSQEVEQCAAGKKTSVYFSNGMFTDYADAGRSLAKICFSVVWP